MLLYRQLLEQFCQCLCAKDKRHLENFSEIVAGIVLSGSACLTHWLPFLSHRKCQARAHLARLQYFLNNPRVDVREYYETLLKQSLSEWAGEPLRLVLDTTVLWDEYCVVALTVAWGGRSILVSYEMLEHQSATVGAADYVPVLERGKAILPPGCVITLLADRGFQHGQLIDWCEQSGWELLVRMKSDCKVDLGHGEVKPIAELSPAPGEVRLFPEVSVLGGYTGHLALANWPGAKEVWSVFSRSPVSLRTFAEYGKRFGGIEPFFKDCKSAGFNWTRSHIRSLTALSHLFALLMSAYLLCLLSATVAVNQNLHRSIEHHSQRGLSFFQLGQRWIQSCLYRGLRIPNLQPFSPEFWPEPACASRRKRRYLRDRVEFSRVTVFPPQKPKGSQTAQTPA